MMDRRRHSVDIPISKTLVALRRVRSLRDPSTNSMSKFSLLVENLNWETNSSNGITLGLTDGSKEGVNYYDVCGLKDFGLHKQKEEHVGDLELYNGSRESYSMLNSCENSHLVRNKGFVQIKSVDVERSKFCQSNHEVPCGNNSLSERYCSGFGGKGPDLTCMTPSSACLEGVGSSSEPIERPMQIEEMDSKISNRKPRRKKHISSSRPAAGDFMSRSGSPCLSISDVPLGDSSSSISLYGNEEVDIVDPNNRVCGLSCCWSKPPRFRESNLPFDREDWPLLSGEVDETVLSGQGRGCKQNNNQNTSYSQSPRSLNQKFRLKSFTELVGQNVVAMSLLSAVLNGKITPFYIFHGPHGTGKTSTSRIFAAALNCVSVEENRPCGLCRECALFFSGRSRDVKEVDSVGINSSERFRYLINNAMIPPVSSRYKVFIIDECHLLRRATWATFLNKIENISKRVVFIMITPDLDKLPRSALSRSQKYHFPKLKEADIVSRLGKICIEEGVDYDRVALDFIATKSNGSLRDAETMLEQLSLLGKKITISLAYELIGVVSDDELLDLLDVSFSSDTSNTVRKARELMRSRIDPMQLISQLANLLMDIIAGKCQEGVSEVKRDFFKRHSSAADLPQLSHALKVLSETEKQLRTSKNQTTWLTVALLQIGSVGSSSLDANDSRLCVRTAHPTDVDFCSASSTGHSLKHLVPCSFDTNSICKLGMHDHKGTLESIWYRATEFCESNSLRNFLRRRGNLACVCFNQGLALVELEFHRPDYVSKAEKSWKIIASGLQSALGCNFEIRINFVHGDSVAKYCKAKYGSFSLFSCYRRLQHESQSATENGSDPSQSSNLTREQAMTKDKIVETCSSDCGSQISHICCHNKATARNIRKGERYSPRVGMTSHALLSDNLPKQHALGVDSSQDKRNNCGCEVLAADEPEKKIGCFSRTVKSHNKLFLSDTCQMTCTRIEQQNHLALSLPSTTSTELGASGPCIFGNSSTNYVRCSSDEDKRRKDSKVHCWRIPTFPLKKAWQLRHQPRKPHFVEWILTCATMK